jgi:hypothetical protein
LNLFTIKTLRMSYAIDGKDKDPLCRYSNMNRNVE